MSARTMLPLVVAGLLAAGPVLASGEAAKPRVKVTKRTIEAIGMDGPIVAYDLAADSGCNQVLTWNVNTNGGKVVSGDGTCDADSTSTGGGVTELAVAGTRVAWVTNLGGNTESSDDLYTSSLPKPKERHLLSATRTGDIDGQLDGEWIVGVVGDGDLLAVSSYSTEGDNVSDEALRVIGSSGLKTVARGTGRTDSAAAGSGRIAVVRDDGKVALYSAAGKLLHVYATKGASDAALTQHRLLSITDKGLQVFDTGPAGRSIATWKAPINAVGLDAESDIAVYSQYCRSADSCGRNVWAVRVSTGKTVLLARAPTDIEGLEIEPAGAIYAYNTSKGHLVLRSMAQVEAALR